MKKSLIISVILFAIFALSACGIFGGDDGGGVEPPKTNTGYKYIVLNDESVDLTELRSAILDKKGPIGIVTDTEPESSGEIVIGSSNRDVTARAKAELEKLISADADADVGYVIYSYGGSVALYWTIEGMHTIAVADLVSVFVNEKNMTVSDGVVHSVLFDADEYAEECDWLALKVTCPSDVYTALRRLSSYYDADRLAGWMANLWDDEIGGFYFSISARDNEPYLPDIESTSQALGWLYNNNFISSHNDGIPNDIKMKVVDFAKSLQSANDGYFYHPQWGQSRDQLQVDRYARDLSWATGIINRYTVDRDGDGILEKQYPNFCAPEGTKCELHAGTEERCSFVSQASSITASMQNSVTGALGSQVSSAVSKINNSTVRATASSRPDYTSEVTFRDWLYATNSSMGTSSGNAQVINALQDEIIANGYCEVLLDFLDEKQQEIYDTQVGSFETPTGLWQYTYDYHAVWGLLKYTPFYNDKVYGRELKYAEHIVDSCIEVIMLEADGKYQANDIYNMWQGMQALFNNVMKYSPESLPALQQKLRDRGAELIQNSINKLESFKRTDGAFSMYSNGISQATIYGAPIAMCVEEGDVNATVLICSMYRCMFTCLGYSVVHLGNANRGEKFIQMLYEVEPIVKNPAKGAETWDFEDGKTVGALDNQSGKASITIVDDDELERGNSALQFTTFDASAHSTFGDGVTFSIGGLSGENCIIFETDIMIKSAASSDILQIRFGDFYRLRLHKSGSYLKLTEMLEVGGAVSPNSVTIGKIGEWIKLRIECYKTDDDYDTPRFKVFVNDECILISEGAYGINSSITEYTAKLLLRSYKSAESVILLDNVFCHTQSKIYSEDLDDISDIRDLTKE